MKTKNILLICCCVLSFTFIQAQNFTNYNKSNSGILNNKAHGVMIDKKGYLWAACDSGVSKFDGINWTNYNFLYNTNMGTQNYCIAVDKNNIKWIGTKSGLYKYNDTIWTHYTTANSGLPDNGISSIAIDSNQNKWLSSGAVLTRFDNLNWVIIDTMPYVNISVEPNGNHAVWAVSSAWHNYVFRYNNNTITHFEPLLNYGNYTFGPTCVVTDHKNNKWISSQCTGMFKYDGEYWTYFFDSTNFYTYFNQIASIAVDEFNNIWCGSSANINHLTLLMKFDGVNWTYYNVPSNYDMITQIIIDSVGNFWMGTNHEGVWKMDCIPPTMPTAIIGPTTVVKGQGNVIYHLLHQNDALNYHWTFPTGFTIVSTSLDSIIVNVGANAVSGQISTYGHSSCGTGGTKYFNVTVTLAGVNELTDNTQLSVYPNPAKDKLTIESNINTLINYDIVNLMGQTVNSSYLNSGKTNIDVSAFAKGIYTIKLFSDKGNVVKKFVKE